MATGILRPHQVEDIIMTVPGIHHRAALLAHEVLLREKLNRQEDNEEGAAEERQMIVEFLRLASANTVRGAHAHKLADQIEAGAHRDKRAA
jgi:hypothetical protein